MGEAIDMKRVAVIGLGAMGGGMAGSLLRAGLTVVGCDVSEANLAKFKAAGGETAGSPAEAAAGAFAVVSVVVNAAQTEAVLFAPKGAAETMADGAVFISSATMAPEIAKRLAAKLEESGRLYLDAPISGGAARAADGQLTVLSSGKPLAKSAARPVLDAVAANVYDLGDEAGFGAAFKMINQLLAGVHIVAASEAMALAARLGLDLEKVYQVISKSAGNSWMFENRMKHVVDGDYRPLSAVNIFTKDLGIIMDMARASNFPVPMSAAALQMFTFASANGMGGDDDSSVARLYADVTGTKLPPRIDK